MAMAKVYEATATREGRWWLIRVPEIDAVTQARRASEINEMTAGLIQAVLDLDSPPEVTVTIELPDDAATAWTEAGRLHTRALETEARAATIRRRVIRQLLADGWTQADAAAALGVSYQRVQQLAQDRANSK